MLRSTVRVSGWTIEFRIKKQFEAFAEKEERPFCIGKKLSASRGEIGLPDKSPLMLSKTKSRMKLLTRNTSYEGLTSCGNRTLANNRIRYQLVASEKVWEQNSEKVH